MHPYPVRRYFSYVISAHAPVTGCVGLTPTSRLVVGNRLFRCKRVVKVSTSNRVGAYRGRRVHLLWILSCHYFKVLISIFLCQLVIGLTLLGKVCYLLAEGSWVYISSWGIWSKSPIPHWVRFVPVPNTSLLVTRLGVSALNGVDTLRCRVL